MMESVSSGDLGKLSEPVSSVQEHHAPEVVSSGDVFTGTLGLDPQLESYALVDDMEMLLESTHRIEDQMEAVISILLVIVIAGLLHYIYRFLRIFF